MAANFIEEFIVNFTLKHFCTVISFCLEDYAIQSDSVSALDVILFIA